MNSSDLQRVVDDTFNTLVRISNSKGEEYAGKEDRLANFKRLGAELNLDPRHVLWVFATKHLDSIRTYLREVNAPVQRVLSEPIDGRIDDVILYLILLKGLIYEANLQERGRVQAVADPAMADGRIVYPTARGPEHNWNPGPIVRVQGGDRLGGSQVPTAVDLADLVPPDGD